MDPEQGFLEAIRRRPGSRADRLVYADWLSDRGDPRGDFIRLQCQAARLARGSPRRLDLEALAHDLLLRHEADWLGPLLGVVGNWEWRGGLLDWVTVTAEVFLANAGRWLPALPLLGVHLRQARPHMADLARCQQLIHLTGLFLGDNDLRDDDLLVLLRSPHLRRIRSHLLHSNKFNGRGVSALARTQKLPRLRELCLGHNRLNDKVVVALASSARFKRLRSLELMMCHLQEPGIRALGGSPLLARLHYLGIGTNFLNPGCLAELARAPGFANLRGLSYFMNQPDDVDVATLAASPHAAGLRYLGLDCYDRLDNQALTALAASPHLGRLRMLSLGCRVLTAAGVRALAPSRSLSELRVLEITQGNQRARGVAKALLGGRIIRRLRDVRLSINSIGVAGLTAVASHPRPLHLRRLNLTLSPARLSPWEALLKQRSLAQLTSLSLYAKPPGAVWALVARSRLPELRMLELGNVPDLDEFEALLASALFGRLHHLRINLHDGVEAKHGSEVIRRLTAAWNSLSLHSLGLVWTLSAAEVL
jgi:uncharacterized protein (TIGR02996 family)